MLGEHRKREEAKEQCLEEEEAHEEESAAPLSNAVHPVRASVGSGAGAHAAGGDRRGPCGAECEVAVAVVYVAYLMSGVDAPQNQQCDRICA